MAPYTGVYERIRGLLRTWLAGKMDFDFRAGATPLPAGPGV
jgi:hypothetical protein